MPKAPAPLYSLVYIYGLRCACAGIQVDNKEIAEKFSVIESDVVNVLGVLERQRLGFAFRQ
mgnify:FL=1